MIALNQPRSIGLHSTVRVAATTLLRELFPLWSAEKSADWKRVVRPQGQGSFSINIEAYRGIHTWIAFQRKFEGLAALAQLTAAVVEFQPELLGYISIPGRIQKIQDAASLATCWCGEAEKYTAKGVPPDEAIEHVLDELNRVLLSRQVEQQVRTPLSGLTFPDDVQRIVLNERFSIRKLSDDEISDLGSHDITSGERHDVMSLSVSTAAFFEEKTPFELTTEYPEPAPQSDLGQQNQDQLGTLLAALHVLKEGRVGVIASFFDVGPLVLPGIGGYSTTPLVRHPFASMNLIAEDVPRLLEINSRLANNQREAVRIACVRLMDAEHRMSQVDALLDAVFGLEALLNPHDSSELSFRVALNYGFLGAPEARRTRFDQIRNIQKIRNRVVHGGRSLQSEDPSLIHEQAVIAKACLRDAIQSFLFDKSLLGNFKLDADFWLNRVLPPAALALPNSADPND